MRTCAALVVVLLLTAARLGAQTPNLVWEQVGVTPPVAQTFVYRMYLDGKPLILQGVTCAWSGAIAECSAPLPTPSDGPHTLFLTAANSCCEGERSGTISFTWPLSTPPPPPPSANAPIAPQNLWLRRGGSE